MPRYQAFWIEDDSRGPGVTGLHIARDWLRGVPTDGDRIIVVNVRSAIRHSRVISDAAARFMVVSPGMRGIRYRRGSAVLALWPHERAFELAERLALDGSLCVVPGVGYDAEPWIVRSRATNLRTKERSFPTDGLPQVVTEVLDSIISFDGYNDFLGGGGKDTTISRLRRMVGEGLSPDPVAVENYVRSREGLRSPEGARRLREWYEGILQGKRFRGEGGRYI